MTCDELEQILHPYLDGELGAGSFEQSDIEQHLSTCPACARRVAAERHFKQTLRAAMEPLRAISAPASLRARVEAGFSRQASRSAATRAVRYGAIAAGVIIAAGGTVKMYQLHARHLAVDDAAASHARHFPLEIRTAAANEIESWTYGKVDYRVNVPELPNAKPAGARLLNVKDKQAVYISYDTGDGLYVLHDDDAPAEVHRDISENGYNVVTWGDNNITYMFVGHDPTDADVMQLLQPHERPVGLQNVDVQPAAFERR